MSEFCRLHIRIFFFFFFLQRNKFYLKKVFEVTNNINVVIL